MGKGFKRAREAKRIYHDDQLRGDASPLHHEKPVTLMVLRMFQYGIKLCTNNSTDAARGDDLRTN